MKSLSKAVGRTMVISHLLRRTSTASRVLLSCLMLAACVAAERDPNTFVMASGADLESANPLVTIHPLSKQLQRYALFVTLFRYDSALVATPYFARSFVWSNEGKRLSMQLHDDLLWSDGMATSGSDVAFTFLAAKDRRTGFSRAAELQVLDTVIAVNDSVVEMHFAVAQARLPALLSELPILPAHVLSSVPKKEMRTAGFSSAPVTNGPFRFESRIRGQSWSFRRNAAFPASLGGPPTLDHLTIAVVDEATTKFAGLASGELDMAGISPAMAGLAMKDRTLHVISYPVLFSSALCFNTTRPPFDDARVRRAVSLSLDRARMTELALAGYATPSRSPVPPDSPNAPPPPPALQNVSAADSMLDAAGWARATGGSRSRAGKPFTVDLLTVGSGDNVVEQLIQSDLADRGIRVNVRQIEMGAFLTAARAPVKQFDMLVAGIPGDLSMSYIGAMFASDQRGGALDYTGFHSNALDALIVKTRNAGSPGDEERAYANLQLALDTLAPATWLYHSRGVQGVTRALTGATMDLRGELVTLHDWTLLRHRVR